MTTTLETLDKANVQRLVDNIAQKNQKLDLAEEELEKNLIKFTSFFATETPMYEEVEGENGEKEKKIIEIPYQFRRENHSKFKEHTLPISRHMWAFTKVVSHMRTELYQHEIPLPNITNQLPMQGDSGESKGIMNSLRDLTKKLYRDPHSPYNATKDLLEYYSKIPFEWNNLVHIFEINIRHRPRHNTRVELDRTMDDLVIFFNAHIETNLVPVVHYAHLILKGETESRIVDLLTTYNQIAERHEKLNMMNPQTPFLT